MAAAQSSPVSEEVQSALSIPIPREAAGVIEMRLAVHDTSRLEWAVSMPLPARGHAHYAIEVDLEVPAHVLVRHSPWDQLQEFARLDGPEHTSLNLGTIDGLRRFAVGVAAKLSRASEGFARHCRLIASPLATSELGEHFAALERWLGTASAITSSARARLDADEHSRDEVRHEMHLVDEYLSLRLLEMLAGAERELLGLSSCESSSSEAGAARREAARSHIATIDAVIHCALEHEVAHRREQAYPEADPDSPQALGRYLDRASQLKKHFQEVLFLEPERFAVSERLRHWIAGAVAVLASTWAFVGQLYLARGSASARLSSSIVLLCVLAGLIYAVKDRIKEVGRNWFADNVHRFYAQRIARYRAPAKTCATRDVVVFAKESFLREDESRPDPLNPHSSATMPITSLRYRHQGSIEAVAALESAGISRVKHVFRYDLSPLFGRLDDATKPVPVFDGKAGRLRFADAPRGYRVPVRLVVRYGDHLAEQTGSLVLHKRGLERIEMD
jgi:hypothetical protein